jgi:hypothetical protein
VEPLVAWRRADVNDSMKSGISRDCGSRMLWPPALMLSCAMRRVWCPEGRTRDLCHNTIPYYHASAICPHHSMLPVVPGLPSPSSPPTAAVHRTRHPEPVDAETERRGRIRNIEFKVLMYTQLAVLNNQRLRDFDTVGLKDGPHIHK